MLDDEDEAMLQYEEDEHMNGEMDSDDDEGLYGVNHPMHGQAARLPRTIGKAFASDSENYDDNYG